MAYAIKHVTSFRYDPAIRESVMEVRMQPRSDARQRCLTFSLEVAPQANVMVYRDFMGNTVHHFDIPGRHSLIELNAEALVDLVPASTEPRAGADDWRELDAQVAAGDFWEMLLPSPFVQPTAELQKLAREIGCERHGRPLECLMELSEAVFRIFEYLPNSTEVDSPIDVALRARRGVCQDFAHVMIALVRRLDVPCRYVSGYLFHPNSSADRSTAGATHAWVEAWVPPVGWTSFDPTNNLLCGERHIRVALGRDYSDVAPTRGVYKGEAASELSVSVAVTTEASPEPQALPPATVIRSRPPAPDHNAQSAQQQQQQQQQRQQQQ
jgi:transglutaminase-like putative cysteine protease